MNELKWEKIEDNDGSAIENCIVCQLNILYEISPNQRLVGDTIKDYIVSRYAIEDSGIISNWNDGILGRWENDVGICCGNAMFCAMGLPPNGQCNGDLEYVKLLAEKDLENLKNGVDNVFVRNFMK